MSFLADIQKFKKNHLRPTVTIFTKPDGKKIEEQTGELVHDDSNDFFVVDTTPDGELHQVTNHLFIGSQDASANINELKNKKITHILNLALCPNYFEKEFIYKNVNMYDIPEYDISLDFDKCIKFFDDAITSSGNVLCHCNAGISRSSSIICAYLIQKQRMTFENALALVRKNRPQAKPNDGFIIKLKLLEKECFTDG